MPINTTGIFQGGAKYAGGTEWQNPDELQTELNRQAPSLLEEANATILLGDKASDEALENAYAVRNRAAKAKVSVPPGSTRPNIPISTETLREVGPGAAEFAEAGQRAMMVEPTATVTNFPTARDVTKLGPVEQAVVDRQGAERALQLRAKAIELARKNFGVEKKKATATVQAEYLKQADFIEQTRETKNLLAPPGTTYELSGKRSGPMFNIVQEGKAKRVAARSREPLQLLGDVVAIPVAPTNEPTVNDLGREFRGALRQNQPTTKEEVVALMKSQPSYDESLSSAQAERVSEELKKASPKLYKSLLLDQMVDERLDQNTKVALKASAAANLVQARSWLQERGKDVYESLEQFQEQDPDAWQRYIADAPKAYIASLTASGDPALDTYYRFPGLNQRGTFGGNVPDAFPSSIGGLTYRQKDGRNVTFNDELGSAKALLSAINSPLTGTTPAEIERARLKRTKAMADYNAIMGPLLNEAVAWQKNLVRIEKVGGPSEDRARRSLYSDTASIDKTLVKKYGADDATVIIAQSQDVMSADDIARVVKGVPGLVESPGGEDAAGAIRSSVSWTQVANNVVSAMQSATRDGNMLSVADALMLELKRYAGDSIRTFGKQAGLDLVQDLSEHVSVILDERFDEIGVRNTERLRLQYSGLLEQARRDSNIAKIKPKDDLNVFKTMLEDGSFDAIYGMDDNPEPSVDEFAVASGVRKFGEENRPLITSLVSGDDGAFYDVPYVNQLRGALMSMGNQVYAEWATEAQVKADEEEKYNTGVERERQRRREIPAEKADERQAIESINRKRGYLTSFSNDLFKSTVTATFRNDEVGILTQQNYEAATTEAAKLQVLNNEAIRMKDFGAKFSQAEGIINNVRDGRITIFELHTAEEVVDGVKTDEKISKLVPIYRPPKTGQEWLDFAEDTAGRLNQFSDVRDRAVKEIDTAHNLWLDKEIAAEAGYEWEKLSAKSRGIAERIRKAGVSAPWWFWESSDLYSQFYASLPDGKKKARDVISELPLVSSPNIPLAQAIFDTQESRAIEKARSSDALTSPEIQALPPGTWFKAEDGKVNRRK